MSSNNNSNMGVVEKIFAIIGSTLLWGIYLALWAGLIYLGIGMFIFIFNDAITVIGNFITVGFSWEAIEIKDIGIYISVLEKFIMPYCGCVFLAFIYCVVKIIKNQNPLTIMVEITKEMAAQSKRDKEERRKARIWQEERDRYNRTHRHDPNHRY